MRIRRFTLFLSGLVVAAATLLPASPAHAIPRFGEWESLGGVATSSPALASTSFNRLDLLVKGTDNHIWSRRWTGDRWADWYQILPQEFTSAPAATSSTGQVVAVARGTDNAVYQFATDSSNMTWL